MRADASQEQLVFLLLDQGISRVPVVDDDGWPIGVVGKTDFMLAQHECGDTKASWADAGVEIGVSARSAVSCETSRPRGVHAAREPDRRHLQIHVLLPAAISAKRYAG